MNDTLLDIVKQSPEACKVHDKVKWMSLFDDYHIVEDPVGSTPHVGGVYSSKDGFRGNGALSRFYESFIAPNKIAFDVRQDIVCGLHVARDLNINIEMSPQVNVTVPMHLIYELRPSGDTYKVARLAAHWAFLPMIRQLMGKGLACLPVVANLSVRLFKYQGLMGTLGFSSAAFNIGKKGRETAEKLLKAINNKDLSDVMSCFCHDEVKITGLEDEAIRPSMLLERVPFSTLSTDKVIVSGDTVSMSIKAESGSEGLLFAMFDGRQKKIQSLRFYLADLVG